VESLQQWKNLLDQPRVLAMALQKAPCLVTIGQMMTLQEMLLDQHPVLAMVIQTDQNGHNQSKKSHPSFTISLFYFPQKCFFKKSE
jgi:hypothetical protein